MLIYHIDMNSAALRPETIRSMLHLAAESGYDSILWEVEDKIRWDSCPAAAHPEAMTKEEFRGILTEARALGLEAIPLLQTFGHGEYVLMKEPYRSMRELPDQYDCYCVSKPETRAFLKSLLHEYLELFGEIRYFHLGGDEAYSFGKCPVCSRRDRMELYAEHLLDVSAELREKGIRPCCWQDMIVANPAPESVGRIPRDFLIFNWHYGADDASLDKCDETTRLLRSLGFDVVLCPAVQCFGESPFVGEYERHAANCRELAFRARQRELEGLCVTSWSIRGAPKMLQAPIVEFAARCFLDGTAPDEGYLVEAARKGLLGVEEGRILLSLQISPAGMGFFSGIGWTGFKDSLVPSKERADFLLSETDHDVLELKAEMARSLPGVRAEYLENRRRLEGIAPLSELGVYAREGAALEETFIGFLDDFAQGRPISPDAVERARARTERFYAGEQRPASAKRFSEIVWAIFAHLSRTASLHK